MNSINRIKLSIGIGLLIAAIAAFGQWTNAPNTSANSDFYIDPTGGSANWLRYLGGYVTTNGYAAVSNAALSAVQTETDPIWSGVSHTVTTGAAAGATAIQPGASITNLTGYGSAALANTGDFATSAQGLLAASAVQPAGTNQQVGVYVNGAKYLIGDDGSSPSLSASVVDGNISWAIGNPSAFNTALGLGSASLSSSNDFALATHYHNHATNADYAVTAGTATNWTQAGSAAYSNATAFATAAQGSTADAAYALAVQTAGTASCWRVTQHGTYAYTSITNAFAAAGNYETILIGPGRHDLGNAYIRNTCTNLTVRGIGKPTLAFNMDWAARSPNQGALSLLGLNNALEDLIVEVTCGGDWNTAAHAYAVIFSGSKGWRMKNVDVIGLLSCNLESAYHWINLVAVGDDGMGRWDGGVSMVVNTSTNSAKTQHYAGHGSSAVNCKVYKDVNLIQVGALEYWFVVWPEIVNCKANTLAEYPLGYLDYGAALSSVPPAYHQYISTTNCYAARGMPDRISFSVGNNSTSAWKNVFSVTSNAFVTGRNSAWESYRIKIDAQVAAEGGAVGYPQPFFAELRWDGRAKTMTTNYWQNPAGATYLKYVISTNALGVEPHYLQIISPSTTAGKVMISGIVEFSPTGRTTPAINGLSQVSTRLDFPTADETLADEEN